jgi:hypothetical protein
MATCWRRFTESDDFHRPAVALLGSPVAFLGALGLPLAGLAGRSIAESVRRYIRGEELETVMLVAAAVAPPLACTLRGTPRGEVEHVYIQFVPMLAIAVAAAARRYYARGVRWLTHFAVPLLVLQSVLVEVYFETYW